jgi:hypothetical protein
MIKTLQGKPNPQQVAGEFGLCKEQCKGEERWRCRGTSETGSLGKIASRSPSDINLSKIREVVG